MQKNKKPSIPWIASFIILLGILMLSYNYVQAKRLVAYEYMDNIFYEYDKNKKIDEDKTNDVKEEPKKETEQPSSNVPKREYKYQYVGYLEIPKINLRKGIVDKASKDNDVEKNLFVASNSTYPDIENGNLIIAGHSGTGYKAFFKNLYKLGISDIARVEYNGRVYTYQITKIYEQKKTGRLAIYRDEQKTTLTLITCTKDSDDKQTIYILELVNVE